MAYPMVDSDIRIARLLQAAAVLTTSGHTRADAVLTAFDLEKQIIAIIGQGSEKERLKETQDE